jgi:phosphatidylinositol alpha-1,6-mannosyltransferase
VARTFILTNDFPPRRGGIESFVKTMADKLAALGESDNGIESGVVVYTASMPGSPSVDAACKYPVIRDKTGTLLPTKRVEHDVVRAFTDSNCDRVLIGSSVPLGLLAPALRAAGAERIVALTHGHEVMYARTPGLRNMLRQVGDAVDYLTAVTKWTRRKIGQALTPEVARSKQVLLAPGIDTTMFYPGCGGDEVRARLGISPQTPVVVCVARANPRKGQDRLISAWPEVLEKVPNARLVLVGDGKHLDTLHRQASHLGLGTGVGHGGVTPVIFVGSVPREEVPAYMDAGDVFAMLCRSHPLGFAEGIGTVFLEAAACGKPLIVGRSGGAPETVLDGESGYVVNPHDISQIAARIVELLQNPARAREMGERGREFVLSKHTLDQTAAELARLLGVTS